MYFKRSPIHISIIIIRDLKPSNILYADDSGNPDTIRWIFILLIPLQILSIFLFLFVLNFAESVILGLPSSTSAQGRWWWGGGQLQLDGGPHDNPLDDYDFLLIDQNRKPLLRQLEEAVRIKMAKTSGIVMLGRGPKAKRLLVNRVLLNRKMENYSPWLLTLDGG